MHHRNRKLFPTPPEWPPYHHYHWPSILPLSCSMPYGNYCVLQRWCSHLQSCLRMLCPCHGFSLLQCFSAVCRSAGIQTHLTPPCHAEEGRQG